jgi:hypothetical protein
MLCRPPCKNGVAMSGVQGPSTAGADSTVQPSSSPGQESNTAGVMASAGGGKGHVSVPCSVSVASGWTQTLVVTLQNRFVLSCVLCAIPRYVPNSGSLPNRTMNTHGVGAEVSRVDGPQAVGIARTEDISPESRDATVFHAPIRSDVVNAGENGRLAAGQVLSLKGEIGHDHLGSEDAEEGHPDKTQRRVRLAHSRCGPKHRARRTR